MPERERLLLKCCPVDSNGRLGHRRSSQSFCIGGFSYITYQFSASIVVPACFAVVLQLSLALGKYCAVTSTCTDEYEPENDTNL